MTDIPVNALRYHLLRQLLGFFGAFAPVLAGLHAVRHAGAMAPERLAAGLFVIAAAGFVRLMPSKFSDTDLYPKVRWRLVLIYAAAAGLAVALASWMLSESLDISTWTLIGGVAAFALAACLVFPGSPKAKSAHG